MAVTIENMTMPKSCEDCPFSSCKGRLNSFYCDMTTFDVDIESNKRDADCPLKEVPTGKWIEQFNEDKGEVEFICSECNHTQPFGTDYCWNCGSRNMTDEQ